MVNQSIRDAIAVKPKKLVLNKTSPVKSLEQTLWDAKDKMRGHLEAGEFKQIIHGLVSLGYVSVTFKERRKWLDVATADESGDNYVTNPDRWNPSTEVRNQYTSDIVDWAPEEVRWTFDAGGRLRNF